jgi:very-short-patch-repair endonuclease
MHALPGAAEHDARRDAWMLDDGYLVSRFTDADILSERDWLRDVRTALLSREENGYRSRNDESS